VGQGTHTQVLSARQVLLLLRHHHPLHLLLPDVCGQPQPASPMVAAGVLRSTTPEREH
jgi:hypothetical protein